MSIVTSSYPSNNYFKQQTEPKDSSNSANEDERRLFITPTASPHSDEQAIIEQPYTALQGGPDEDQESKLEDRAQTAAQQAYIDDRDSLFLFTLFSAANSASIGSYFTALKIAKTYEINLKDIKFVLINSGIFCGYFFPILLLAQFYFKLPGPCKKILEPDISSLEIESKEIVEEDIREDLNQSLLPQQNNACIKVFADIIESAFELIFPTTIVALIEHKLEYEVLSEISDDFSQKTTLKNTIIGAIKLFLPTLLNWLIYSLFFCISKLNLLLSKNKVTSKIIGNRITEELISDFFGRFQVAFSFGGVLVGNKIITDMAAKYLVKYTPLNEESDEIQACSNLLTSFLITLPTMYFIARKIYKKLSGGFLTLTEKASALMGRLFA